MTEISVAPGALHESARSGPEAGEAEPLRPRGKLNARQWLRRLWRDETHRRPQVGLFLVRVVGCVLFVVLSRLCKDAAIYTARWPEPVKYGSIVLFLLAVLFFVRALFIAWKVLRRIRLRGVLTLVAVIYLLLLTTAVLTSDGSLPWYREAWETTRDWAASVGRATPDAIGSVLKAPGEFRAAYVGYRSPLRVPGMDAEDPAYLTPIPANR